MLKNKLEKKRFMKVYEELFNTDLSPNAVLLLSFLIDKEPLLKKTEGYYRIPTEFIQNSIGWSSHIIRNTLEELEEYGLIEVQVTFNKQPTKVKSGVCKSRYVKFNEEDIVNLIGEDNVEDNVKDNVNVNVEDNVKGNVKNFNIYQSKQSNQINHNKQSNKKEDISLTRNISESSILEESTIRLLLSNDEENKPISFNEYLTKEKENNINPPSPLSGLPWDNSQPTWLNNERKVEIANEVY